MRDEGFLSTASWELVSEQVFLRNMIITNNIQWRNTACDKSPVSSLSKMFFLFFSLLFLVHFFFCLLRSKQLFLLLFLLFKSWFSFFGGTWQPHAVHIYHSAWLSSFSSTPPSVINPHVPLTSHHNSHYPCSFGFEKMLPINHKGLFFSFSFSTFYNNASSSSIS